MSEIAHMPIGPNCYRVSTLAERWDCSTGKIRALVRKGVLPALDLDGMIRIPVVAVHAYEAQCQIAISPVSSASQDAPTGTSTGGTTRGVIASLRAQRIARKQSAR